MIGKQVIGQQSRRAAISIGKGVNIDEVVVRIGDKIKQLGFGSLRKPIVNFLTEITKKLWHLIVGGGSISALRIPAPDEGLPGCYRNHRVPF